jgi:hypothetical protein
MLLESVVTGVRKGHFARFPAVRAVVETVDAEPDLILALANGAVFFAGAVFFGLVAHGANHRTGHWSLRRKLYLTAVSRGKADDQVA